MTIRREDLAAAASLGLLHYSQIDPLLVYLLQRDVRARRLALAAEARQPRYGWVRNFLWYAAAFLAILTLGLFGVLHASRAGPSAGLVVLVLSLLAYAAAGVGLAAWSRMRGYCRGARLTLGVVMASVPLAVLAVHQVSL